MQLQVHLENQQCVTFDADDPTSLQNISTNPDDTHLTAFFKANQRYPLARTLLYSEFPTCFTWDRDECKWYPRKSGDTIGRLVFIPPNAGERFYARLILSVVKNLQSFNDMRTHDGTIYDTICEACIARGLLEHDQEWIWTLEDAKSFQTGFILHAMFTTIVRDCIPSDPMALWHQFKEFICDDLRGQLLRDGITIGSMDEAYDYGLHLIQSRLLFETNKSMADFGLTPPIADWNSRLGNRYLRQHLHYNTDTEREQFEQVASSLNPEQRHAFDTVIGTVLDNRSDLFFVEGAAGAGKTFLYSALCHCLRADSKIVFCVASSGIAALLLPGGRTAHSAFRIPIDIEETSTCSIGKSTQLACFLSKVNMVIWDECSMQHRFAFEAVDRTLQDVRNSPQPFGGVPTVLGGDFLQTLPVVKRCYDLKTETLHACLICSPLWSCIENNILKLETNMHVSNDPEGQHFATWLRDLAKGRYNDENENVFIPSELRCVPNSIDGLLRHVYKNVDQPRPQEYFEH
jgi:ATP-dependent DNA helicase PIF1